MVFNRRQAHEALERAIELDTQPPDEVIDDAALRRLGDELGLSRESVAAAIRETRSSSPGPFTAVAASEVSAGPDEARAATRAYLHMRGLTEERGAVWRQAAGWWPDLFRYRSIVMISATVFATTGGSIIRLTANLDRIWRAHLFAAIAGLVLLAAAWLGDAVDLASAALLGSVWAGTAGSTYRYRRASIQRRLEMAIRDIGRPDYLLAPW
ncbi:MAG: hypothetical protein KJO87_02450 [Acidimicrobiia bacterium]|nr:hypothetical protein [Acidimicrobiia bacterium]NNL69302.1 hypothetical protein [Acidimicrobiia bacterium]